MEHVSGLVRGVAVLLASVAGACALASPAWAPKYILGSAAYGDCVDRASEVSRFEGTYEVRSFARSGSTLTVTGLLEGRCATDDGAIVGTVDEAVATFVVNAVETFCADPDVGVFVRPGVMLAGHDVKTGDALPFGVDLSRGTVLERTWTDGDPASLRGQLCALDRIAHRRPLWSLAPVLEAFVRA